MPTKIIAPCTCDRSKSRINHASAKDGSSCAGLAETNKWLAFVSFRVWESQVAKVIVAICQVKSPQNRSILGACEI
eukprot:scaffold5954_cov39-Attheya_sp.AAC.2